jgi:hypothetical protein
MSSSQMGSIMSTASSSSIVSLRYSRCTWVSCLWCGILFGNTASGGTLIRCSAPGISNTSCIDNAKQSANSASILRTLAFWSSEMSLPIETCLKISSMCLGLRGSEVHVNIELSPSTLISGWRSLCGSTWLSSVSEMVHTEFHHSQRFCLFLWFRRLCPRFPFPSEVAIMSATVLTSGSIGHCLSICSNSVGVGGRTCLKGDSTSPFKISLFSPQATVAMRLSSHLLISVVHSPFYGIIRVSVP